MARTLTNAQYTTIKAKTIGAATVSEIRDILNMLARVPEGRSTDSDQNPSTKTVATLLDAEMARLTMMRAEGKEGAREGSDGEYEDAIRRREEEEKSWRREQESGGTPR